MSSYVLPIQYCPLFLSPENSLAGCLLAATEYVAEYTETWGLKGSQKMHV